MASSQKSLIKKKPKYSLAWWVKQNGDDKSMLQMVKDHTAGMELPIDWTGNTLDLANALYLEWGKRRGRAGSWYPGFYPTPMPIAQRLADSLNLSFGDKVLDPGCGFGNLSMAVKQIEPGADVISIEHNIWIGEMAEAVLGRPVHHENFLSPEHPIPPFNAVIVNPPFGNCYGVANIEVDFMTKIAELSVTGTRVAAVLTPLFFLKTSQKKYRKVQELFEIVDEEPLPDGTFKPLTGVNTVRYVLKVAHGGRTGLPQEDRKPQAWEAQTSPRQLPGEPVGDYLDRTAHVIHAPSSDGDDACPVCGHPKTDHVLTGKGKARHEVCMNYGCKCNASEKVLAGVAE